MDNGVIFQTISGKTYAYITENNHIVTLDKKWINSLDPYNLEAQVFDALFEAGEFKKSTPHQVIWPMSDANYKNEVQNNLQAVVLEITQECTLRCEYCIYSGNYSGNRTHSNVHMSKSTVKKALDFYRRHSINQQTAKISLYGGEALIRFDVVQFAVSYAKKIFHDKELSISLSSNGTTLTNSVIEWLDENPEVSINITINGFSHDKYRKFPNGTGSINIIMRNLYNIKKKYPELWKRVNFLANIVTTQELLELKKFYQEEIGKPPLLITGILEEGGNEIIQKIVNVKDDSNSRQTAKAIYIQTLDDYLKPYFYEDVFTICTRPIGMLPSIYQNASCCMPFTESLFISASGALGLCEKVTLFDGCGDLNLDINFECAFNLLNSAKKIFNTKCNTCWCHRLCDVCFKDFSITSNGTVELPASFCERQKKHLIHSLELFCELAEKNPHAISLMQN